MSKAIDEKIVEMRFDNRSFEQGSRETMNSISKLKEALNFTSSKKSFSELESAAKNISFDSIADSVKTLEERFSTLGIVGMTVIQNLTNAAIDFVKKGINYASDAIVKGGITRAMNIENAHFQLQSLLKDEEKVQLIMQNANDSVTGTAYAYDEAAKAASMFAASGIEGGEQMERALKGLAGVAAMTNAEYSGIAQIYTTISGQGRIMGDQLLQFAGRGMNAAATLRDFFNDVNAGVVQTTDSVKAEIKKLSGGDILTETDIRNIISDRAKNISFEVFSEAMYQTFGDAAFRANETVKGSAANIKAALARIGAGFVSPLVEQNSEVVNLFNAIRERVNDVKKTLVFDEQIGNVNALSKQFTDSVLEMAGATAEFLRNADVTKPMEVFYYGVETVKNLVKGLASVLSPVGKAFSEVFLSFSGDDVISFAAAIEDLTSRLKLSDKSSEALHDTFYGLFSTVKFGIDIFAGLLKAVAPISRPITSLTGGVLQFTGALGRGTTKLINWVQQSDFAKRTYDILSESISKGSDRLREYVSHFSDLSGPLMTKIFDRFEEFREYVKTLDFSDQIDGLKRFGDSLKEFFGSLKGFDVRDVPEMLGHLKDKIAELLKSAGDSKVLSSMSDSFRKFSENLKASLNFDGTLGNIDHFKDGIGDFASWIKNTLSPLFENLTIGNVASTAGSFGMIYALIRVAKSFDKIASGLNAIPSLLGSVKTTLVAYQKNLNATMLLKIAGSIAILAAALVVLSMIDSDKLYTAAKSLALVSAVFLIGVGLFVKAAQKGVTLNEALYQFSRGLSGAMRDLAKAVKIKAMGNAFKNLTSLIVAVVASVVVLALLFKKDRESMTLGVVALGAIMAMLTAFMITTYAFSTKRNSQATTSLLKATISILLVATALTKIVKALGELYKIDLPDDWKAKTAIMGGLIAAIGFLSIALGVASKIGGGKSFKLTSFLGVSILLFAVIKSLDKLFKMELPDDWKAKSALMMGMFGGITLIIGALGGASRAAGGQLKAASTLLALSAFLITLTGSLVILSLFPFEKIMRGATALSVVLLALGGSLYGAAKVTSPATYKSVLAMTIAVAAITVSLSILSLIKPNELISAAASLGIVLLSIGGALNGASKIIGRGSTKAILATVVAMIPITLALTTLSERPWDGMISAAASMGIVLLSFAKSMKIISSSWGLDSKKVADFLLATLAVIPIGTALYVLSEQPWNGMLGSAAAMSAVILAFAGAMMIISKSDNIKTSKIGKFLLTTTSLLPIVLAIKELANEPVSGMIGAATAMSELLLALSAAFAIVSRSKDLDDEKLLEFGAMTLALLPIVLAIKELANKPVSGMIGAATAMSELLLALSAAFVIVSHAKDLKIDNLLMFGAMTLALYPIVDAIKALANEPISGMIGSATALSEVLLAISASFVIISLANPDKDSIAAFLSGVVGVMAVAIAIKGLAELDIATMLAAATAISEVLLAVSAAVAICSMVGKTGGITAALDGLGAFMLFLAAVTAMLVLLGTIFDSDGAKKLLNGGAEILVSIGEAIGEFVGAILKGFLEKASEALPTIGTNLSKFMTNLQPFFEYLDGVNQDSLKKAGWLSAILLAFTVIDLINGLMDLIGIGGNLVDVAKNLSDFMDSMNPFLSAVSSVESETVEAAKSLATMLLAFTAADLLSGIANLFGLGGSLSEFGEQLADFGPHIAKFAESVDGIDASSVEAASEAANIMSAVAKNLYGTGGLIQKVLGEKNLADFAKQLTKFGPAIKHFAEQVKDITPDMVKGAAQAATLMAEMADKLPPMGGFLQKLTGEKSLTWFGIQLDNFAPSIVSFADQVKDVTPSMVKGATQAATLVAEMADKLPPQEGLAQKIFGQKNLSDFGEQLADFGPAIAKFASKVKLVTPKAVEGAASAARIMMKLSEELPDEGGLGGLIDWLTGKTDLGKFGERLAEFGSGMKNFYDSISAINMDELDRAIAGTESLVNLAKASEGLNTKGLKNLSDALESMASEGIDAFVDKFKNSEQEISDSVVDTLNYAIEGLEWFSDSFDTAQRINAAINKLLTIMLDKMQPYESEFYNKGTNFFNNFIDGFKFLFTNAEATATQLANKMLTRLREKYEIYKNTGKISAMKYLSGVKDQYVIAINAANTFANKMIEALKLRDTDFTDTGIFLITALINGMKSMQAAAASTGSQIASEVMYSINTMIETEGLYNPVITPVVDMSHVRNSVSDISRMFNDSVTKATAEADTISAIRANQERQETVKTSGNSGDSGENVKVEFTQNNYSPKALSASEVYRQTRNLISTFQEVALS